VNAVPDTVTVAPSIPFVGENDETAGGGRTVKTVVLVVVPPGPVIDTMPVDAPLGTVIVTDVSECTVKPDDFELTVAASRPLKPVPVTLNVEPTMPLIGANEAIVGMIPSEPELDVEP
jgi:hypothetical protein